MTEIKQSPAASDGAVEIEDAGLEEVSGGGVGALAAGAGRLAGQPPAETPPLTAEPTIGAAGPKYGAV